MNYKIAILVDVDNFKITASELNSIISRVSVKGEIVYGKLYNYSERRNSDLEEIIEHYGYDAVSLTTANRKSKKSTLDLRIVIDAVRLATKNNNITAFCLVTGDGDLVPLISALKAEGKFIIGCFNTPNEANEKICNEVIRLFRSNAPVATTAKKITTIGAQSKTKTAPTLRTAPVRSNIAPTPAPDYVAQLAALKREQEMAKLKHEQELAALKREQELAALKREQETFTRKKFEQQQRDRQQREQLQQLDEQKILQQEEAALKQSIAANEQARLNEEQRVENIERETNRLIDIKNKKRHLAELLEGFAKRTSELNFDSNEDIGEKQRLLDDINRCLNENDFNPAGIDAEDRATFNEIKELITSLKETIVISLED